MSGQILRTVIVACLVAGAPVLAQGRAEAPRSPAPAPVNAAVRVETVARGLEHPWALAFLPDGRMLVTERPGRLRIVGRDGRLSEPLAGVPQVLARGQGGLLDVALDPRFADNRLVYLSYAEPGEGGTAGTDGAQDLSVGFGKIVRINPDGSVPRDNPFVGRAGAQPEFWSYGHRNVQGAALHPQTGQLWTAEHGARGGGEL